MITSYPDNCMILKIKGAVYVLRQPPGEEVYVSVYEKWVCHVLELKKKIVKFGLGGRSNILLLANIICGQPLI